MTRERKGSQIPAIPPSPKEFFQVSFDLNKQDQFVHSLGCSWEHWAAMPSPVGLKSRGDYRRSDTLDTTGSNGMVYTNKGNFQGVILNNNSKHKDFDGGLTDNDSARMTLPRYYNGPDGLLGTEEVNLLPGDRLYCKDVLIKVPAYQRVEHNPHGEDYLQFPVISVVSCMDSRGKEYKEGTHFKITKHGNIKWYSRKGPGVDPDTGEGRIYTIRYIHNAFWYVTQIYNEVRVTSTTKPLSNSQRVPERMPYHISICREYVYHNQNRGSVVEGAEIPLPQEGKERTIKAPVEPEIDNHPHEIINLDNFE